MSKPAARLSDPTSYPHTGHGTNPIVQGSPDILFDGLPAARMNDKSACDSPLVSELSSIVFINGQPAATVGSKGAHGNVVTGGSGTVIIGNTHTPAEFIAPTPVLTAKKFSQSFVVTDSETGLPLAIGIVLLSNCTTAGEGDDIVSFGRQILEGVGYNTSNRIPALQVGAVFNLIKALQRVFIIQHLGGHREYPKQLAEGKIFPVDIGMEFVRVLRTTTQLLPPPSS